MNISPTSSVYDVSRRETFNEALETWLTEVETYVTSNDVIKLLVANKIDKVCLEKKKF